MQAIIYTKYGSPQNLQLKNVNQPVPNKTAVLIKLRASALNAPNWAFLTGKSFYTRAWKMFKPRNQILGSDISEIIEKQVGMIIRSKQGMKSFTEIIPWQPFLRQCAISEKEMHG
ncbi:MAG: hypothetical protein GF313_10945 [Caldithrix sp.]|nr:hypothetical protein [Caldithrix sp.]